MQKVHTDVVPLVGLTEGRYTNVRYGVETGVCVAHQPHHFRDVSCLVYQTTETHIANRRCFSGLQSTVPKRKSLLLLTGILIPDYALSFLMTVFSQDSGCAMQRAAYEIYERALWSLD